MDKAQEVLRIPKPGEVLAGKYRIEGPLAEGGMGVVLEATHIQLEERVAIKFLRPEMLGAGNSAEVTGRFLREARAAIKIRSEHVVRVFDVSALDTGVPYIVMELLQGEDLDHLLSVRGKLGVVEALDHVLQACEALAEAHALGIIHRDLKPANLFLTQNASGMPIVKVLDFGISKVGGGGGAGDMSMTTTQAVMGSPLYMSPEQMRATKDADARSDVWAVGVILYELIAGKPPFAGETMTQVCAAILTDMPTPLGSVRKDMPPGLDRVILKCLEKRASDRYATIADLAAGLAPYASLVGQEAARRTSRTAKYASSGRLPVSSSPEDGIVANQHEPRTAAAATSTAWGEEGGGKKTKPRKPLFVGLGISAVVVIGLATAAVLRFSSAPASSTATPASARAASATTAPASTSAAPTPMTPTLTAETPPVIAPTPPLASATATAVVAAKPTAKKPAAALPAPGTASAKPPVVTPKASWNERK